jgi:hypothetical protein
MDMQPEMEQVAEIYDALSACDELHIVISRLKRLGLLSDEEDRETKERIEAITETLAEKLPEDE